MTAVTWAVSPGCTAATESGSNDTSHPVGAVPASLTDSSGAVSNIAVQTVRVNALPIPKINVLNAAAEPGQKFSVPRVGQRILGTVDRGTE